MTVMVVLTCVSLRARALASLPLHVVEVVDERRRNVIRDHDAMRLFARPNPFQTKSELCGMLETHRVLRGNAYAWKNIVTAGTDPRRPGGRRVQELIPMHPDQVEVEDDPDDFGGPTTYTLHRANGQAITMASHEVVHLKGLSTNGRVGRSVLQDMREAIGGALASQAHASALWQEDATPRIALSHPDTLSEPAQDRLERRWSETYGRGPDKRRVAILEEGMQIKQLSMTPEDSQFLESRQFARSELAGAFHVPPHMIGDTEKSTSWGTGIEQQQIGFLVFTLRPDLVAWEERLGLDLLEDPARFKFKFNVSGMLRGDFKTQMEGFQRAIMMGVYSPNDVRAKLDENPIPGETGDTYLQPSNMMPLGSDPSDKDQTT